MRFVLIIPALILSVSIASAGMIKLPLPQKELAEAQLEKSQSDFAAHRILTEAYRLQLKKLGWNCQPQDGEIVCITSDEQEGLCKEPEK